MKRNLWIPILLMCSMIEAVTAAEFQAIVKAQPGTYVLTISPAGAFSVEAVTVVSPGVAPVTPPVPVVPDPTLSQTAIAIRDAAKTANDSETAANLSAAILEVRKLIPDTIAGYRQIAKATQVMADGVIPTKNKTAWEPTRRLILDGLTGLAQEGASDAQFSDLLGDVSAGLDASLPANEPRQLNMVLILKLLELFITQILPILT